VTTDYVPKQAFCPPITAAIIKIIAAKLIQENEGPVNGSAAFRSCEIATIECLDSGANRPQQKRWKVRMVGGF
jgi:hypothetical protein